MSAKNWFLDFSRGAALGTGILPGVSVGTVGIIVGVYDRLLASINGLRHNFWKSFLALLPIALGCIIAAIALLFAYSKTKDYIQFEIVCVFAGCIIGGIPVILKELKGQKLSGGDALRIVLGFIIAAGIGVGSALSDSSAKDAFLNPNANWWVYPITFVVGFVAAVACILPGISGSMVLYIFGLYDPVVGLYIGDQSMFHDSSRVLTGLILTLLLLVGVIVGLFAVSKAMVSLLQKHSRCTYTMVLGFVGGSIVSMFMNNQIYPAYPNFHWYDYLIGSILLIGFAVLLYFLVTKTGSKKKENERVEPSSGDPSK